MDVWSTMGRRGVFAGLLCSVVAIAVLAGFRHRVGAEAGTTRISPAVSQGSDEVHVEVDKSVYHLAEPIIITVTNGSADTVYLRMGQTYCSPVTLQRRDNGQWQSVRECAVDVSHVVTPVAAGRQLTLALNPVAADAQPGPIMSALVTPVVSSGTVQAGPAVGPPQPGTPIPRAQPLAFQPTAPDAGLMPGVYRIAVLFAVGTLSGTTDTAYSPKFVLTD